jgi:DNA polymerase I-like protein with 3'-5' exonuclease and polymerase domains
MDFASRVMGQIHDSLITSIDPKEQKEALPIIKYVMEDKLREVHKWVITPMDAEFEITEPGGNWYSLKDIKVELPRNFVRF